MVEAGDVLLGLPERQNESVAVLRFLVMTDETKMKIAALCEGEGTTSRACIEAVESITSATRATEIYGVDLENLKLFGACCYYRALNDVLNGKVKALLFLASPEEPKLV